MILICDSGSTKADWVMCDGGRIVCQVGTQGINPVHQTQEEASRIIGEELMAQLDGKQPSQIFFYGAGCAYDRANRLIADSLRHYFEHSSITISSDLLGAARALCGRSEGIACILGTGSNSCLYDGEKIISNTPPLGYILGDEGSAAVLGRSLLGDCLKQQLPTAVCQKFMEQYNLTTAIILERIYRTPLPNRFLGSLAPFLWENREVPEVSALIMRNFTDFFTRNVINYHHPWLPINIVGSIAYHFDKEIRKTADNLGLKVDKIEQSPLEGLMRYHNEVE